MISKLGKAEIRVQCSESLCKLRLHLHDLVYLYETKQNLLVRFHN